jgi:hypothetical protein
MHGSATTHRPWASRRSNRENIPGVRPDTALSALQFAAFLTSYAHIGNVIKTVRVTSVSAYVDTCSKIRDEWGARQFFDPWFRGQRNSDWGLKPSLYVLGLEDDEGEIRDEFVRQATQLMVERVPSTDWEWYFVMRHHGAPTRLLDWTDSALVALFFALNSNSPGEQAISFDAAVWVLDPWWLNGQVIRLTSVLLPEWKQATPYLPPPTDGRLLTALIPKACCRWAGGRGVACRKSRSLAPRSPGCARISPRWVS